MIAVTGFIASLSLPTLFASDVMPAAEQNALVHKYCAVCHTDAARNGGLSLEHFDAAYADPSLAAMLVSKITSGVPLQTVSAAAFDSDASAFVFKQVRGGAMNAAGLPVPEKAKIEAFVNALATEATGANKWSVHRVQDAPAKTPTITASILLEVSSGKDASESYRLLLTCNTETREGAMQLAWSPVPKAGTLSVTVDGKAPLTYKVEGTEKMGNGSGVLAGPASIMLHESKNLPAQTLTISNLFPNQIADFPFGDLPRAARQLLTACFGANHSD